MVIKKKVNSKQTKVNRSKIEKVYSDNSKVSQSAVNRKSTPVTLKNKTVNLDNSEVNLKKNKEDYHKDTKVNQPELETKALALTTKARHDFIELSEMKPILKEIIDWYEAKHKNVIERPSLVIDTRKFKSKPVTKSFKMYPEIVKKLDDFKKSYPQYQIMDIVTAALTEFFERYAR
jgi:uncharacterized protein YacL (UPF0231 family)